MINKFTIKEVRDFWDNVADIYESSNSNVGYVHYNRFERAIEYGDIKPGQKVLNIWSRMGGFIPYARKIQNIELINREASQEFINKSIKKFPSEDFKITNLENLGEFADNYFDRIISLETLEHVPKPLVFLKELNRVLKSGGRLVMSLPPKGFEVPTVVWDKFFGNHGEGPHNFLWPGQVKKLLKQSSFILNNHYPTIILPFKSDKAGRESEKILMKFFGKTPLVNFGVRHFYVAIKPNK